MKYVVLVSHGTFAPGLHSVLKMLAGGEREDVISVGLEDGMSADEFAEKFSNAISKITEDDEIILLGDIVGGSPLTNAIEQVSNDRSDSDLWWNEPGNGIDSNINERRRRHRHAKRQLDQ
mgnify:CR=1 FL=1